MTNDYFAGHYEARVRPDFEVWLPHEPWGSAEVSAEGLSIAWRFPVVEGFAIRVGLHPVNQDTEGCRFQTNVGFCSGTIAAIEEVAGFGEFFPDGQYRGEHDGLLIHLYAEGLHRMLNGGAIKLARWHPTSGLLGGEHWRDSVECALDILRPLVTDLDGNLETIFAIDELGGGPRPSPVSLFRDPHLLAAEVCVARGEPAAARSYLARGRAEGWLRKSGFPNAAIDARRLRKAELLEAYCDLHH
jgi:hypothetical protein